MGAPSDGKAAACVVSIPSLAGTRVHGVEPAARGAAARSAGRRGEARGAAGPVEERQGGWMV